MEGDDDNVGLVDATHFPCVMSAEIETSSKEGIDDPRRNKMEWSVFFFSFAAWEV